MERWNSLPVWLRIGLVGIVSFVLGGLLAFGYSYRPLHGALAWKVDQLEARLDERNLENLKLTDELKTLRGIEEERIDPATLAQVEVELDQTKSVLKAAEAKIERLDRRRRDAIAGSDRWRKRYEKLRDGQARRALPAAPAPKPAEPAAPLEGDALALPATGPAPSQDTPRFSNQPTAPNAAPAPNSSAAPGPAPPPEAATLPDAAPLSP